jgi:hypothetical protein
LLTDLFLSNTDFGKYHIAILLVLICAWKMYVVDACFYMNDIHVKKYITELAYWPIFFLIKNGFWKIFQIYIIHSASTIVWITIKQISQCLRIVVYNIYCFVYPMLPGSLDCSFFFTLQCSLTFILFTVWYCLWFYSHLENTCMTASCQ